MSKENTSHRGNDGSETRYKGESQQSQQKGAKSVASNDREKHKKDNSDGADKNTTKKQENSI